MHTGRMGPISAGPTMQHVHSHMTLVSQFFTDCVHQGQAVQRGSAKPQRALSFLPISLNVNTSFPAHDHDWNAQSSHVHE